MTSPAAEQYRRTQRRALAAVGAARMEWARVGDDLDSGWSLIGPRLTLLVRSAQVGAATDGAAYVGRALEVQGQRVAPLQRFNPAGLAGLAPDGRDLGSLLYGAVVHARTAKVESLPDRLRVGREWLDTIVHSTVNDASRDAQQAAVVARPHVSWVRFVNPPCCQRCAVLSGRVYRWNQGFQRHPRCNCLMVPETVAAPATGLFRIGPGDVKDLTRKQADVLEGGADLNKVINDYQRKKGAYSPPTRVEKVVSRSGSREKAAAALAEIGVLI